MLSLAKDIVQNEEISEFLKTSEAKEFIKVDKENLTGDCDDRYVYLKLIAIFTPFIPFLFMFKLLPTLKETNELQEQYAQDRKEIARMI